MNTLPQAQLDASQPWSEYLRFFEQLVAEGKTTGENQSAEMLHYTKLNLARTRRSYKTLQLSDTLRDELLKLDEDWLWLAITEPWCGDAAQILGAVAAIAEHSPKIELRTILRDEHDDLMQHFLTNGGKAIPIVICVRKSDLKILGHWGPRPAPMQKMVMDYKADQKGVAFKDFVELIHSTYAKDKSVTLMAELEEKVKGWRV